MKRIFLILVLVCVSCFDDDSTLIESDNTAHISSKLTKSIKTIALHDASYDDIIDNSFCFSLEFPYEVLVNSELKTINSVQDIETLEENSTIEIVYPVSAVFFNYEKHQINSTTDFGIIANACENNFDIDSHSCLDFQYPVAVKVYNPAGNSFHTTNLDHDQDMYIFFDNLHDTDIYEIEYPILLSDHTTGTSKSISSNAGFENIYANTIGDCQ